MGLQRTTDTCVKHDPCFLLGFVQNCAALVSPISLAR